MSSDISGQCHPSTLSEILKKTLHEQGVPFTVAPYSALAQVTFNGLPTLAMLIICSLYTMRSTQANSSMPFTAPRSSSALALTGLLLNSSSATVVRIRLKRISRNLLSLNCQDFNGSIDETVLQRSVTYT